jgi:hypothetical protein
VRLFSVRHEFPTEWAKFQSVKIGPATPNAKLVVPVQEEHFPFWSRGRLEVVKRLDLLAKTGDKSAKKIKEEVEITTHKPDKTESKQTLNSLTDIPLPKPPNKFTLQFTFDCNDNSMEDLWLAVTWGGE